MNLAPTANVEDQSVRAQSVLVTKHSHAITAGYHRVASPAQAQFAQTLGQEDDQPWSLECISAYGGQCSGKAAERSTLIRRGESARREHPGNPLMGLEASATPATELLWSFVSGRTGAPTNRLPVTEG